MSRRERGRAAHDGVRGAARYERSVCGHACLCLCAVAQQNWPQVFGLGGIPELIVKTPNTKWFRRTA